MSGRIRQEDLARRLGIARSLVSKYLRRGMPLDPEAARAWRAEHVRPRPTPPRRERVPVSPAARQADPEAPATGGYAESRARREAAAAALAELDLRRRRAELLPAAELRVALGRAITSFRSALTTLPDRLAGALQAASGDPAVAREAMAQEIERIVADLAAAAAQALRSGAEDDDAP